MAPEHQAFDPDFSREVLEELYSYPRKRRRVAWLLWLSLGLLGAHRFYLGRDFTGVAMLFTGGGGLLWWMADAVFLERMVREHNEQQDQRERAGLPPVAMDFMPPLRKEILRRTPEWVERWSRRSGGRRGLRLAGDVLVLVVAGWGLGTMVGTDGALEAVVAVLLLAAMTSLGAGPDWLDDLPLFGTLERWTHRLRLFYYHNEPGSPPMLLLRALVGVLWAPFRAKDRAEVKLYLELGAAFTVGFLALDVFQELVAPAVSGAPPEVGALLAGWLGETFTTFFLTYAVAAPVGAVLTLHLLVRPTHAVPRILAALTALAVFGGTATG